MPEICCSQAGPLTGRCAQCPPTGLQALHISEARLRSPLLGTYLQEKAKNSERALFTRHQELHCSSGPDPLKPEGQSD